MLLIHRYIAFKIQLTVNKKTTSSLGGEDIESQFNADDVVFIGDVFY